MKFQNNSEIFCVDAVPVLHESASLLTVLETALISVDVHCKQNSLDIIGIYFCNQAFTDDRLVLWFFV